VKYAVVPQVYTIIAFGASILLWPSLSGIAINPSTEGMPRYLIHPLFTLEFSLWLSTAIAWFIVFALSLGNIHKQALKLTEAVGQNLPVVSLATITVIVALSGCVGFSDIIHFELYVWLPALPKPNLLTLFRAINAVGSILCVTAWIIAVLWRYLSVRWARS